MRTVSLQQICDIQIGKTPSRSVPEYWGGELPWVTISDFAAGRVVTTTKERITRIGAVKSGSKRIPRGTLLLSFKLTLGKRTFSGCDLFTNEAIAALHVLDYDAADRDYLYWALGSIDYDRLVDRAAKGKTLNKAKLKLLQIPLPPLAEQKRIAGILDAADALRAKRRQALGQLDTLLRSTFLDMFGDPVTNPMGWEKRELRDLCRFQSGYAWKAKSFNSDGIGSPVIRIQNVGTESSELIHTTEEPIERFWVERGEYLLSLSGSFRLATWNGLGALLNQRIVKLTPGSIVTPAYFGSELSTQLSAIEAMGRHALVNNVALSDLKTVELCLPPLDLQQRFAAIVESIEQQKTSQRAHLAELDTLFACLQSRAFRGDL